MLDQSISGFPRSLLEQPVDIRRHYFETKVVAHQCLKKTYETLLHTIRYPAGKSLIMMVGPTGVGKTTLLERIVKQLIEDASCVPTTTPGCMPVVIMEVPSPDSGNFSWKDFFTRALIASDEPMLTDKITYDIRGIHRDEQGRLVIERTLTALNMRQVLEKCWLHRQPRAFIVDEAQHFKKVSSGRRLLDQMDTLKSLANMTSTVHVLVGTYDLLGMMNLSAQLDRRSTEIHFPRYHIGQPEDLQEFKKLLRTFQRHMPLAEEPDLESHYEYFYERSLGCTGMLKAQLNKAFGATLDKGERTLTSKIWEQCAEPPLKLKEMLIEIRRGEKAFEEQNDEGHLSELRELLGLSDTSLGGTSPMDSHPSVPNISETSPKRKKRQRVGQRNTSRDSTGRKDHNAI